MVKCDIIKNLMAIVPGIKRSVSRVVVKHGQVAIFVGQRDVNVLIGGRVGGVSVVHFGST